MDLQALGYGDWTAAAAAPLLRPGHALARVTAVDRGVCLIRPGADEIPAELAGKLRFAAADCADLPCVGDWVVARLRPDGGGATIIYVVPRQTVLRRKTPGKTQAHQLIAANLDTALIMQACGFDFNPARLDRYLVMTREGGIEPWIILTKTDLLAPDALDIVIADLRARYPSVRLLPLSNTTGAGLDALRALLEPARTYCLLGSSGVGKTSLLNRLLGDEAFATRVVSATGEGVHTTTRRQLIALQQGALLIDTPGMRELGVLGAGEGLDATFDDIREHATRCRFTDCTHTGEPGCAVRQAVADGALDAGRHRSYMKLKKETDYHDLSYGEKRRKDRAFGRFIKSVKKELRD